MPVTYRLEPGATTYPGADTYPGLVSTTTLFLNAYIDLGDPTDASPNWNLIDETKALEFSISRGRDSELSQIEPGTAMLKLDNRDRAFDPGNASSPYYPYVRPMTRFKLVANLDGVEHPMFVGYADSYQQEWPAPGFSDSHCTIAMTDEFKLLSLDKLPVTDPPRDTYEDVIRFDKPSGYWTFKVAPGSGEVQPDQGGKTLIFDPTASTWTYSTGLAFQPIVGDPEGASFAILPTVVFLTTGTIEPGEPGDAGGLSEFACELWYATNTIPPGTSNLVRGPDAASAGAFTWKLEINASGQIVASIKNSVGNVYTATSPTGISINTWYHLAFSITSGSLRLYVNGSEVASSAVTGSISGDIQSSLPEMRVASGGAAETMYFNHLAFYRFGLTAARILAHYQAGALRGFGRGATSGGRITSILDSSDSSAARSIEMGVRTIQGRRMRGQDPLSEIRDAVNVDNLDAMFFVARNGTLVYYQAGSRAGASAGATFDDDGTDLPYVDVEVDYSETFLYNEFNVTRPGGTVQTASDSTSQTKYFKRSQSLDPPVVWDSEALTLATALKDRYKDPFTRITSISFTTMDTATAAVAFDSDLGDKVRIFRTQPGGSRIDQSSYIQKIEISGAGTGVPWSIRWHVSPL